jgi:hypothetical protein
LKRRTFLISGAAVLCGAVGWRFAISRDQSAIMKVLYKKLNYLKLDEAGVRQFASDLAARKDISSLRLHIIDAADGLYTHHSLAADNRVGLGIRHGEDRVVTQYLMSSDFFIKGADKDRTVSYLGYYDPLVACNNPFARPVDAS